MLRNENVVIKSNKLNEMKGCNYSLGEHRLLAVFLSRINPLSNEGLEVLERTVIFRVEEFRNIVGIKNINGEYLENCINNLLAKTVEIELLNHGVEEIIQCPLFETAILFYNEYDYELCIKLTANIMLSTMLFNLDSSYIKYQLWNCLRLKSKNQFRMYELMKRYETITLRGYKRGEIIKTIDYIKEFLGLDLSSYSRYTDFKTKVLDTSSEMLRRYTDIYFEYSPVKKGKKIVAIRFLIHANIKYEPYKIYDKETPEIVKRPDFKKLIDEFTDKKDVKEIINEYIQTRIDLQSPFSYTSFEVFLKTLSEYSDKDKIEMVSYAVINNWKGIYPTELHQRNKIYKRELRANY